MLATYQFVTWKTLKLLVPKKACEDCGNVRRRTKPQAKRRDFATTVSALPSEFCLHGCSLGPILGTPRGPLLQPALETPLTP